jgi:hypothetical protein
MRSITKLTVSLLLGIGLIGGAGLGVANATSAKPAKSTTQAATPYCYTIYILGQGYQKCQYI